MAIKDYTHDVMVGATMAMTNICSSETFETSFFIAV